MQSSLPFQTAGGETVTFTERGLQTTLLVLVTEVLDCNRLPFREKKSVFVWARAWAYECVCRECTHMCVQVDIKAFLYCS